jgi:hypothetical protein
MHCPRYLSSRRNTEALNMSGPVLTLRIRVLGLFLGLVITAILAAYWGRSAPPRGRAIEKGGMQNLFVDAFRPSASPSSFEGRAALVEMLKKGIPASGWPFDEGDLMRLNTQISEEMTGTESCQVKYRVPTLNYYAGEWVCVDSNSSFHRTFTVSDGRRYKLLGRFIRSDNATWRAEIMRAVRVMYQSEVSEHTKARQGSTEMIEIVPTVEQAKRTLVHWLQFGDHGQMPRDVVAALESKGTLSRLTEGVIEKVEHGYTLDEWLVIVDDSEFQKRIPLSPTMSPQGPMLLVGRFDLVTANEWRVVQLELWPYMK